MREVFAHRTHSGFLRRPGSRRNSKPGKYTPRAEEFVVIRHDTGRVLLTYPDKTVTTFPSRRDAREWMDGRNVPYTVKPTRSLAAQKAEGGS